MYDPQIGTYYVNHNTQSTQLEDPRLEWKSKQEEMLREYLCSAQDTLEAKKEIFNVKTQRLHLAQEEYNHLNALAASRTSCEYQRSPWRLVLSRTNHLTSSIFSMFFHKFM